MPSRRSFRLMQMVYQRYISGNVFRKHSAAQLPQATLSKDDMTKKDYRDVQTRLIPASTPLHLLTTFNCTLFEKRSRDQPQKRWHPSVVSLSIASIAFHPARSAPTNVLKSSTPSKVVPSYPHTNRWPQTNPTIVSKLATTRWVFQKWCAWD